MPTIHVAKAFRLRLTGQSDFLSFAPGVHENVPEAVAGHWYTKEHLAASATDTEPSDGGAAVIDPETAGRDQLIAHLIAEFSAHLASVPDDGLREMIKTIATKATDLPDEPEATAEPADPEGPAEPPAATETKAFADMTDDELRAFIKARDGRTPHANTLRENLLAKALNGTEAEQTPAPAEPEAQADQQAPEGSTEPAPEAPAAA